MGFDTGFRKIAMDKEAWIAPALKMIGGGLIRAGSAGLSSIGRVGRGAVSAVGRGAKFVGNTAAKATGVEGPIGAGLTAYGFGSDVKTNYQKSMGGYSR